MQFNLMVSKMKIRLVNSIHIFRLGIVVLLLVVSTAAMARGFYTAVDAGHTSIENYCQQPRGYSCSNNRAALRLGVGYQFNPFVGIEVNYGNLGSVRLNGSWAGPNVTQEGKFSATQVAAIFSLPYSDSFSLLLKLGVARTALDTTYSCCYANENDVYWARVLGFGARYDFSKRFAVRALYEYQDEVNILGGTGVSISLLSAGVVWKF